MSESEVGVDWIVSEVDGILHFTPAAGGSGDWEAFPAVRHFYAPRGRDEAVPLYAGPFTLSRNGQLARAYHGTVRLEWYPLPRITITGERDEHPDADELNALLSSFDDYWVTPPELTIPPANTLPSQPDADDTGLNGTESGRPTIQETTTVILAGETTGFDEVTFLIPNGPDTSAGPDVALASEPGRFVPGHLFAQAAGWDITIDPRMDGEPKARLDELKHRGGHDITHIGRLRRTDGSTFDNDTTFDTLSLVRLALSIATGRSTPCLLPVGWSQRKPIGARWNGAPSDPYRTVNTWIDPSIGNAQFTELLERMLIVGTDPALRGVIRQAVQLLVTAIVDVDVQQQIPLAISGMQMLSYYRFVTVQKTMSANAYDKLGATGQVRALLNDCKISTAIPAHLQHLASAAAGIDIDHKQHAPHDALATIVFLRNRIVHPTTRLSTDWDIYQWAEAGTIAIHYFLLTILNTLNFQGQIYSATAMPRQAGNIEAVPWAASTPPPAP